MFQMRDLRIDQQAGGGGESRPLGFLRQSGNAERAADTDRPIEDTGGQIGETVQLARASGQDYAPARLRRKRRGRESVADHFEYFLDAGLDDANERGTGNKLRRLPVIVPDWRYGDHIA